jgi:hypothetical protein
VVTSLSGAEPNHVARVFIRKTDEFLQQAACWLEEDEFQGDVHGRVKLDFSRIGGQMVWIERVWNAHRMLQHATTVSPAYRDRGAALPMVYTNTPYPDVIELFPVPDAAQERKVLVRAALTLDECAEEKVCIPDWVFSRYKEAIRLGVLGDLQREGGRPYTNTKEGHLNTQSFKHWIAKARDESHRGWGKHEAERQFPRGGFL